MDTVLVPTACPKGQFTAAAYCDVGAYCLKPSKSVTEHEQQPGSQLLAQLQDCNARAQRLLTLLSIHREQGIAAYGESLDGLFNEALACVVHALQAAAAAKQPLLTASSQHSSAFCKLLERLHLLDALWKASNPGPTPGAPADTQPQQHVDSEIEPAADQLEAQLNGTCGLDAVLAALIGHAQQNAAAGGKLKPGMLAPASSKQEVLEVSCLSAVQEHHSAARALPLLIRLYFNTTSRAETLAAGKPEPLSGKLLERSLAVLAAKPVVPGCADVPVCLTSGLQACTGLSELAAARKLKLPTQLGKLDFKAAFKLDQSYSLQEKVAPLLQQHDELCDLLSQLALEIQQAVAVDRDINPKALDNAEQLVSGSINFAAAARNSLLDLDAWRLSTCGAGSDSTTPTSARTQPEQCLDGFAADGCDADGTCDRYKLKDEDVVPFMSVLGAIKGLTSLLADSSSWLQPLLQETAVKQLNDFAFCTLPALSKLYARNPRLQDLLRAISACLQGQFVEVGEDVDAAAVPLMSASSFMPSDAALAAAAAAAASHSQLAGRPLGEGFEGFKERWQSMKGSSRSQAQQQAAAAAAAAAEVTNELLRAVEAISDQQQQAAAEAQALQTPADAEDAVQALVAAAAAEDVEAATAAAAAAAAAARSAANSPCSISQVEVDAGQEQQCVAAVQQEQPTPDNQGSCAADSGLQDTTEAPVTDPIAPAAASAADSFAADVSASQAVSTAAPAAAAQAAGAQHMPLAEPSKKRTLKGLFKLRTSGRRKDIAAEQAATAAAAAAAAAAATAAAAAPEGSSQAVFEQQQPVDPITPLGGHEHATTQLELPEQQEQQEQQQAAAADGWLAQRPPCAASAWMDSETDMLLCQISAEDNSTLPASLVNGSLTDLNGAGFERPPDLPWEAAAAAGADDRSSSPPGTLDDSPQSVARATAHFEHIAAAHKQAARLTRLSSAGREAAGVSSRSSPGGWESLQAAGGARPSSLAARLSEVTGSPLSRKQVRAAAAEECDAEQHPEELAWVDSPLAIDATEEPQDRDDSTHADEAPKRRPSLFGFRARLLSRTGSEPQPEHHLRTSEPAHGDAEAEKHFAALQQDKEQAVLLAGQECEEGLRGSSAGDAPIPASWGPGSPQKGKQRMKTMLSMLRRGGARTASEGAAAAVQAEQPLAVTSAMTADQQLAALGAVVGECGIDGIADADVAGSQCGSDAQPDASEDFDEDQPSKTRRVVGLMNRIRVFTQGAKEQQAQQSTAQQQQAPQHGADTTGGRSGLKGLRFAAKLKKSREDRHQSRFADASGVEGSMQPLEVMPSAASLQLLRVLLELLMHEIKAETKKHLMMQLHMAAAAAAGSAGVSKPDASIARPLKQVKAFIKAVQQMQLMVKFPQQLLAAADLSDLWVGAACGSSLAAMAAAADAAGQMEGAAASSKGCQAGKGPGSKQQGPDATKVTGSLDLSPPSPKGHHPWSLYNLLFEDSEASLSEGVRNSLGCLSTSRSVHVQELLSAAAAETPRGQRNAAADISGGGSLRAEFSIATLGLSPGLSNFPASLMAACTQHMEEMPVELPLLALQVLWDARKLLKGCGLLQQGLLLLQQHQERLGMCCYMQHLVPTAYEHFKALAAHQTVTVELLSSCKAAPLQPVKQLYLDSLMREPCTVVMQGDYADIAAEATSALQPGTLAAINAQLAATLDELSDAAQELQQHGTVDKLQRAAQRLQQAELEAPAEAAAEVNERLCESPREQPVSDQQPDPSAVRFSGVFSAAKPSPEQAPAAASAAAKGPSSSAGPAGGGRAGRKKRQGRASALRSSGVGSLRASVAGLTGEQPAGVTPLMQKLEAVQVAHAVETASGRCRERRALQAWGACELDVRQWLLAGMLQSLQQDAAVVVQRCSADGPTALVESQLHASILQRTHALLSQYTPLPITWEQLWQQADSTQQQLSQDAQQDCGGSSTVAASISGLLQLLNTAMYDAEAQVLLAGGCSSSTCSTAGVPEVDGVLAEVQAAVQPLRAFLGRQHLTALRAFTGPLGLQQLIAGVLQKLELEQALLPEELLVLQKQLPASLLQLPPAEQCHSAGAVLQFYQQQLSNALEDHAACAAALACLQRIGNCVALLHLLSMESAVHATPVFMQVAPLLGIIGRPLTDAAAAAECFEGESMPTPPPALASAAAVASGCQQLTKACTPGLLMPEIETLLPSDNARHTHEMQALRELHQEDVSRWEARQEGLPRHHALARPGGDLARHRVWQASHFQRLLLGPDAEKVRGPAMLLTQTAELRAWRATEGVDVLGPCLQKLQAWAVQLQEQLSGQGVAARSRKGAHGESRRRRSKHTGRSTPAARKQQGQHGSAQQQHMPAQEPRQPDLVELSPGRRAVAAAVSAAAASGRFSPAAAAAAMQALSAEPSAESYGQFSDRTGDGDLSEVEQQLQALQSQVNAALIAAEERLRVVSMSPPSALMTEVAPRMQLPPEPIPFSLAQDLQQQHSGLEDHPAAALEAEDSVQQASPRGSGCSAGGSALGGTAHSNASGSTEEEWHHPAGEASSSSSAAAADPAFLTPHELSEVVEAAQAAAAASSGLPNDPWSTAGSSDDMVPPAHAKLAYKQLLAQSATASQLDTVCGAAAATAARDAASLAFAAAEQQEDASDGSLEGPSSRGAGLAELAEELSDASGLGSRPATGQSGLLHVMHSDQQHMMAAAGGCSSPKQAGDQHHAESSSSPRSPRRLASASCPGRCETGEDDAASESDMGTGDCHSPRSPAWPGQQQQQHLSRMGSPSPALSPAGDASRCSRLFTAEGSYLQPAAAAEEQQDWEGSAGEGQVSPSGYPTPPITELLYETTCDELVRIKDERDILRSEVEVLKSQLKNRDNTLAMLSGQMLITPRTSAADCESLMRAAMSDCSVGSMALRSQQGATSGVPSLPSNNGTLRGTASAENSAENAAAAAAAGPSQQQQQAGRLQQQGRGSVSRPGRRPASSQPCDTSAAVSTEASEIQADYSKSSVRAQQTTPCADVSIVGEGSSGADQQTCNTSTPENASDAGSSSCNDSDGSSGDEWDDGELSSLAPAACLISTEGCGASRKLKMPHSIRASRRRSSSSSSSSSAGNPSPWAPAQLAVALSALKFVLLLDVALGEECSTPGFSHDAGSSAVDAQAQTSPLRRLRKAVEGVAAEAAAVAAGMRNQAAAATGLEQQQQPGAAVSQRAAALGSGRMMTAAYGDGPLLATAVLLQLSGQSRRFDTLDATGRIAHWVEYDAVKSSGGGAAAAAAAGEGLGDTGGVLSPRSSGAATVVPSGLAAIVGAPGGIGTAAEGIAPPKPRSKKRQEEEAESIARERAAAAAQQQLLERLAAAHRQAARVSRDGSCLAARFAPAAPARSQKVKLRVFRADRGLLQQMASQSADGAAGQQQQQQGGSCRPQRITLGGGMAGGSATGSGSPSHAAHTRLSGGGDPDAPKVPAVPVKPSTLQFLPCQQPWAGVRPTQRPIQTHPSLPMARPQTLLLTAGPGGVGRGGADAHTPFAPPAAASLPPEAAAAAAAAAAAGTGIVGPSGKLLTGASVAPRAGLVAAARVMAAREVLLQAVPRNAAYSFSVVSDQNRSGRPEDGYSMAPSSADLDSNGPDSPRRSPHRAHFMAALGGRQRTDGSSSMEQWLAGGSPAGALSSSMAAAEAGSPSKQAGLSRSPTRRARQ